jgi:NADH-quinone oxidoreductase subunit H
MCFIFSLLFLGGTLSLILADSHIFWLILKVFAIMWLFIGVRAIVPRYRYDQLMYLGWKNFLPLSLFFLVFYYTILIISLL